MKNKRNDPERSLVRSIHYHAGRDSKGHVAIRYRGTRHKRLYRLIDFKRNKHTITGTVAGIEYDPYRGAAIALIHYADGDKDYILAPLGMAVGNTVVSGENAEARLGNALPIGKMPVGTQIHNLELNPKSGGKLVRGAGTFAVVLAKDGNLVRVKLPSGEIRLVDERCFATIGQLSNIERKNRVLGKAGIRRHMGKKPHVRGVAQNPHSHPHGGGEGRSGIGMPSPKSPWGKRTLGKRTRRPKPGDKYRVQRRK